METQLAVDAPETRIKVSTAECVALAVLVLVDTAGLVGGFSRLGFAADVITVGGVGVLLLRTIPGAVLMTVGLVATSVLPPQDVGLGVYAPLIAVWHVVGNRRSWGVVPCVAVGLASGLWSSRRAGDFRSWAGAVVVWLLLYAMAWLTGRMVARRRDELDERLSRALEAQRLQIARELHDNVSHDISLIVMRAHLAQLDPTTTGRELAFIVDTATRANGYLRHLMDLIRPGELVRPVSLSTALQRAERDLRASGLKCSMQVEGDLSSVPHPVSDALARVLKEGVNNMVRHATDSAPCLIMLSVTDDRANLGMRNGWNGCFGRGLGLPGMRERVEALGGTFQAGPQAGAWVASASVIWSPLA